MSKVSARCWKVGGLWSDDLRSGCPWRESTKWLWPSFFMERSAGLPCSAGVAAVATAERGRSEAAWGKLASSLYSLFFLWARHCGSKVQVHSLPWLQPLCHLRAGMRYVRYASNESCLRDFVQGWLWSACSLATGFPCSYCWPFGETWFWGHFGARNLPGKRVSIRLNEMLQIQSLTHIAILRPTHGGQFEIQEETVSCLMLFVLFYIILFYIILMFSSFIVLLCFIVVLVLANDEGWFLKILKYIRRVVPRRMSSRWGSCLTTQSGSCIVQPCKWS